MTRYPSIDTLKQPVRRLCANTRFALDLARAMAVFRAWVAQRGPRMGGGEFGSDLCEHLHDLDAWLCQDLKASGRDPDAIGRGEDDA